MITEKVGEKFGPLLAAPPLVCLIAIENADHRSSRLHRGIKFDVGEAALGPIDNHEQGQQGSSLPDRDHESLLEAQLRCGSNGTGFTPISDPKGMDVSIDLG
ncbi:hypothetical protein [Rhodococcus xishaensis]|uniref:hypothetical protein n=1 Tax=Rhodococcus xishaensis TaxID=2487364 RepID=UPI0013E3EDD2|nr:hypothetical protein [Rhodococcus xishaensis]